VGRSGNRTAASQVRPLRVLHAITMLELGGAQRNTLDTVASLDRRGFAVALACADRGMLLAEARSLPDVALFELPHLRRELRPLADVKALSEMRGAIRTFGPNIVHTHSSKAGILGRLAAHREGVPVIVHSIHGYGFSPSQSRPVRHALLHAERLAARWTTAFIAVSRRNLEDGVRLRLFPASRAQVIRSGIDLRPFREHRGGEAIRHELGIPASAPLVVQIACFKPQKAPERFVEIAARLAVHFPETHFLLVGDGALRGRLERLRRAASLEDRLHMPGWRRDVPAILDAATVVTLTSRFEGLPRVLVEALAAGVPVVAMAVDGVSEVVRDGENGFLVPAGDVAGIAERVGRILADATLHSRLATRAGHGLEDFERETTLLRQQELYRELACQAGLR
jgi:glycosyltransferase involved in cell wall biosynthesis